MSAHVALGIMAAEDRRFLKHRGFDIESIERAWEDHQKGRPLPGASTISEQTAKNLFLWPGRSGVRKFFEAVLTVGIETLWPKKRILEIYVNTAQMDLASLTLALRPASHFQTTPQIDQKTVASHAAMPPYLKRISAA